MMIRAVVLDIGGVLEIGPAGGEPTAALPDMMAAWEPRLGLGQGELSLRLRGLDREGQPEARSEDAWLLRLRQATGMDAVQAAAFMEDFWRIYLGQPNDELIAYFASLRPRYRTALLSNSFVGARRREQERYHFADLTDLIVYSHEEGIAKPDRRIYELTCERLGVRPDETVFLDDAAPCVAAARALGMTAIRYENTAQAIAELQACLGAS